jgi:hypothetical protein
MPVSKNGPKAYIITLIYKTNQFFSKNLLIDAGKAFERTANAETSVVGDSARMVQ